jgi:hypothetical protein
VDEVEERGEVSIWVAGYELAGSTRSDAMRAREYGERPDWVLSCQSQRNASCDVLGERQRCNKIGLGVK